MSIVVTAQDSLSVSNDSLSFRNIIPGIYLDYGKLLTIASNFETKYEGGFELILKNKWQLIAEIGHGKLTPRSAIENGQYTSRGTYYRIGFGFVPYRDIGSRIGIGVRYAMSNFKDRVSYSIVSPTELQPDIEENFDRKNLSATWLETVLYSDLAMNHWLAVGFQFRVRIMQDYDSFEEVNVYAIPGYGRAEDKSVLAVNLFLKITPF